MFAQSSHELVELMDVAIDTQANLLSCDSANPFLSTLKRLCAIIVYSGDVGDTMYFLRGPAWIMSPGIHAIFLISPLS